jgi:putative polyketide hydroxylase
MSDHVPVLVVGGSLTGLSAGLFLADHGVACVVVERHADTAIHPRARGITARSMELFRGVGLEPALRAAGQQDIGVFVRATALADADYRTMTMPQMAVPPDVTPSQLCACDQDRMEPLLLARARELGADVRFATEVTDVDPGPDRVGVRLRDLGSGEVRNLTCDYLLAADGIHSPIRERLGIPRQGPGSLKHQVSILFRADLGPALRGRRIFACFLETIGGVLVRRDSRLWQCGVPFHPEKGESADDFTPEHCRRMLRTLTGLPDLEPDVVDVRSWEIAALVADRYREGRVFLAGDAAHVTTPRGGLNGNTGIQDVHNLAWKLGLVLTGRAGDGLLDTYEAERRPQARLALEYSLERMRGEPWAQSYTTLTLGHRYHSGAVLEPPGATSGADAPLLEDPTAPTGAPGTRAPHLTVRRDGGDLSLLDLFGHGFTLLTGLAGDEWRAAAAGAAEALGLDVAAYLVGPAGSGADLVTADAALDERYGLAAGEAVLVRPDGFVAWRSDEWARPGEQGAAGGREAALEDALRTVCDRPATGAGERRSAFIRQH